MLRALNELSIFNSRIETMNKLNIKGEDLKNIGFPQGKAIGIAIVVIEKKFRDSTKEAVLEQFSKLILSPIDFMEDAILGGSR